MAIGAPMTLLAPAQADPLRGVRSAEIGSPNVSAGVRDVPGWVGRSTAGPTSGAASKGSVRLMF